MTVFMPSRPAVQISNRCRIDISLKKTSYINIIFPPSAAHLSAFLPSSSCSAVYWTLSHWQLKTEKTLINRHCFPVCCMHGCIPALLILQHRSLTLTLLFTIVSVTLIPKGFLFLILGSMSMSHYLLFKFHYFSSYVPLSWLLFSNFNATIWVIETWNSSGFATRNPESHESYLAGNFEFYSALPL